MKFSWSRGASTIWGLLYVLLVLLTTFFAAVSCAFLLSQAVRTAKHHSWKDNFNAVVIGAAYVLVCVLSLAFCLKRRIAVHRRLRRISKTYRTLRREDLPESVHRFIQQEYTRVCLITLDSQPRDGLQEGWGRPGTAYAGVRFRTALRDTIREIDALAHLIIPRHPLLRPHARMLHHFRFILPLLPKDEDGLTPLHYYDSAIQLARHASREPTENEFIVGMSAAVEIKRILDMCRQEMLEGSTPDLGETLSAEI
ncbi:hypothetical protein WOLCODRAFT_135200 [Wolfiporia cocos MD-104 SS10]|uniref:Defect at low temperature protein 1 n=1 Tax=Wolfiporia cocos (strain MD-104) TaxID=742152 RepID=A0A2H3IVY0_WOLCO|nr:hypothetical protein WOLCODRAFT_135200 [Wolfiporia cocos MD-104 SS10]